MPDGGLLCTLRNGIAIQRRKKHEPLTNMDTIPRDALKGLTDKRRGSKFLTGTSLKDIVEMTVQVLLENDAEPGCNTSFSKVFDKPIGIYRGVPVHGLRVRRSNRGRLAHAIPEDENAL